MVSRSAQSMIHPFRNFCCSSKYCNFLRNSLLSPISTPNARGCVWDPTTIPPRPRGIRYMWVFWMQSYLDGELPLREVSLLLLLLLGHALGVLGRQAAADGTSLLRAEVEWQVLLLLVEEAELGALVCVDDGEDAGDRLADVVAIVSLAPWLFFPIAHCVLSNRTSCSASTKHHQRSSECAAARARPSTHRVAS